MFAREAAGGRSSPLRGWPAPEPRGNLGEAGRVGVPLVFAEFERIEVEGRDPGPEGAQDVGSQAVAHVDGRGGLAAGVLQGHPEDGRVGLGDPHQVGIDDRPDGDAGPRSHLADAEPADGLPDVAVLGVGEENDRRPGGGDGAQAGPAAGGRPGEERSRAWTSRIAAAARSQRSWAMPAARAYATQ
jgi:hypothetical protein